MARPHITPNQHEVLYAQSDATGNSVALTYNTVVGGLDVNIVGGSSAGTQYAELTTIAPATGTLALGRYKSSAPTLTDGQMYGLELDSSGNLKVNVAAGSSSGATPLVSTNNSTATTLLAGAVFTGTAEDVTTYGLINVEVISNVASATDGLVLQQSPDGTNWDILDPYTIAAATGKTFSVPRQAKFFRVVYTNGATNQTSFRLQSIFTPNVSKGSSVRAVDAVSNENDLEQVASFLMGFNGTTWDRLRTTGTGVLTVSAVITGTAAVTQSGTWNVGSSTATGSAVPANAFYHGISDGTNLRGVLGAANALNSTGAGVPTAQIVGQFDDVSPTSITENQFGNIRMSANRNVYVTLRDAAGNERGLNIDASNRMNVRQQSPTSALTSVAGSATSVTLLASNTARTSAAIYNDSTVILYIALTSSAASATAYTVQVPASGYYEVLGGYTGQISGIWASATGNARITELS